MLVAAADRASCSVVYSVSAATASCEPPCACDTSHETSSMGAAAASVSLALRRQTELLTVIRF